MLLSILNYACITIIVSDSFVTVVVFIISFSYFHCSANPTTTTLLTLLPLFYLPYFDSNVVCVIGRDTVKFYRIVESEVRLLQVRSLHV